MKSERIAVIAAVAAAGLSLGGWASLPWLQSPSRRVDSDASIHLERARRLLHQYNAELTYRSLVMEQLRADELDVDVKDPQAVADEAADEYQEQHAALWASFEPKDWDRHEFGDPAPPKPAKASYGNIAGQIRDGVKGRTGVAAANEQLLKEASAEIEEAFAEDASDGVLFEAGRLKGVILYHQALTDRVRAALARAQAQALRRRLAELASGALGWSSSKSLVADSGIDGHIEKLKVEMAKTQVQLAEDRKQLAALDARIKSTEDRIEAAKARSEQARAALEKLREEGVDFSDPRGGETFAGKVAEQDSTYRAALREVQTLESGDLPKAQIDATGDFLRGRYLENGSPAELTVATGLGHDRSERAALAARVEGEEQSFNDYRSDVARLEGIRAANAVAQEDAVRRIAEAGPLASDVYDELNQIESEAARFEDGALKLLDSAIASFQRAAGAAEQWVSAARDHAQALAPETKERSAFSARENDEWLAAHISAQIADARLAKALTYYGRFAAATQNAGVLTAAARGLSLAEADPAVEAEKAEDARVKGIDEVTKALDVLEKAHRRAEKHWTLAAQAAGATYLMVLFGQPDYLKDSVDAYEAALKGRENESFAEPIAARLKRLETR